MSNFTNNRWFAALMLLFLTANIATLAFLWMHKSGYRKAPTGGIRPGEQVFEFLTRELQLDSAQQASYQRLRMEHQAGVRPMQDSLRQLKDRFFSLLQQPNPADSLLQRYSRDAADMDQQIMLFTLRHFQKVRAVCNAPQQEKFDKLIQDVIRQMAPEKRRNMPPPGREGEPGKMPPPPPGETMGPDGPEGPPPPRQ